MLSIIKDSLSVEDAPKIWLRNKLARSRAKAQELAPLIVLKGQLYCGEELEILMPMLYILYSLTESEFNHLSRKVQTNIADHPVGPVDDIVDVRPCWSDFHDRNRLTSGNALIELPSSPE